MRLVKSVEINAAISGWLHYAAIAEIPVADRKHPDWDEEWDKDHTAFVLGLVLPRLHLANRIRRIVVEAYLAGMEDKSDGSSVVPDELRDGNMKDWPGVMHDYIFWLHSRGMSDADGKVWTLKEANAAYRDAWIADGQWLRGWAWWLGLTAGSWAVWNRRA